MKLFPSAKETTMKYPKLAEPGMIGSLKIKNRAVMIPLAMGCADKDQKIGKDFLAYLMDRAKGGVGLIILENTRVDNLHGVAAERQASMAGDELIESMSHAVEMLHREGVKIFTQLHHPGRETFSNLNGNQPVWSSSSKPCGVCQQETHEMTTAEAEEVIAKFVAAAVRSQKSGCDGVELHGAHGYLISQFLSPYTNQRSDRFGGSFEGRLQFVKEIILGIQKKCGKDFPIGARITVDELLKPNGVKEYLRLADGVKVCKELEKLGLVYINVSQGIYESFNALSEPITYPQGDRTDRIRAVKDAVSIPVIAVNMIKEPWFAEKMLEDGLVDFVGLGRAVVSDPEWVNKAQAGRDDEINRCISCTACFRTLVSDAIGGIGPVKCAVNPRAAREAIYPEYPKNGEGRPVAVVGSGVSGLESARVLAERGFKPVVYEKASVPGGQINVANKPPLKDKINWIVEWELKQLEKLGVPIKLNTTVTAESLAKESPYAVFVATGSEPVRPAAIKGINLPNAATVNQVLAGEVDIRNKKVVLVGTGATGLETAEFLCERGNTVTLVEMLEEIGKGVYVQHYLDAMDKLAKYDIAKYPSHQLMEVTDCCAVIKDLKSGETKDVASDFVVLAIGVRSVNELAEACKGKCDKVISVGDALAPGEIESSMRSAFEAAISL